MSADDDCQNDRYHRTIWTDEMKKALFVGVLHFNCHKKDSGKTKVNLKTKWDQLLIDLRKNQYFLDAQWVCKLKIQGCAELKAAFKLFQTKELEYITMSTMNLSSMPSSQTEYQLLMQKVQKEVDEDSELWQQKKKQKFSCNKFWCGSKKRRLKNKS